MCPVQSRVSTFAVVHALALLVSSFALQPAQSQPGTVLSHQKLSATAGNFGSGLDLLDEMGGAAEGLGDLDGASAAVGAVAIGVTGDDDGGTDRGALYVVFLNSSGQVLSKQKISDTAGGFTATLDDFDEFGGSLCRLEGLDGVGGSVATLAVGTSLDDDGGSDVGAVYLLFLSSSGTVTSYAKISKTSGGLSAGLSDGEEFGTSVAWLGDLDGAGPSVAALAVGAIGNSDGGISRGAVYILFLASDGSVLSHSKISDTAGGFSATLDDVDEFGGAVEWLGDLDGAGPSVATLAVGATGDDDGGSGRGAVYILFLDSNGSVLSYQKISSTAGNFTGTLDNLDRFGDALTNLGDLDGTGGGKVALAVGVTGDDDGGSQRGAVWVLFLDTSGNVVSHQKISDTAGNFTGTLDSGDELGGSVATLGDLDGGGASTIAMLVGATGDDDGGLQAGAAWIMFLEGGLVTDVAEIPRRPRHVLESVKPNPFNPRATIPFRLGATGIVAIHLFDAQGRRVRTLELGRRSEGNHEVALDGLDDAGRPLPSGSYFYQMSVDGEVVVPTRKAILIK